MSRVSFSILLFLLSLTSSAQSKVLNIQSEKEYRIIIFIGLECPISQKYMKKIEDLKNRFDKQVDFFAVVPENVSNKQINNFKKEYQSSMTFVLDKNLEIVSHLNAKVTPESFLINKSDEIRYRGAIDNWFYELGKYRLKTTENYLINAIESELNGQSPTISKTEAIGCFIQLPQKQQHHHE
jgi:hypothetical protein